MPIQLICTGPSGPIGMARVFTMLKLRVNLKLGDLPGDFSNPGDHLQPQSTQVFECAGTVVTPALALGGVSGAGGTGGTGAPNMACNSAAKPGGLVRKPENHKHHRRRASIFNKVSVVMGL